MLDPSLTLGNHSPLAREYWHDDRAKVLAWPADGGAPAAGCGAAVVGGWVSRDFSSRRAPYRAGLGWGSAADSGCGGRGHRPATPRAGARGDHDRQSHFLGGYPAY